MTLHIDGCYVQPEGYASKVMILQPNPIDSVIATFAALSDPYDTNNNGPDDGGEVAVRGQHRYESTW